MNKRISTLLIFFCLVIPISQTVLASEHLNLEESISLAVDNNPNIKAQDQDVIAKGMDKRASLGQMLPKLDVSYGYARLNEAPSFTSPVQDEAWLPVVNENAAPTSTNTVYYNGAPSYAYVPSTPENSIPMGTKDNYTFSVVASQTLFTGGALYNNYRIADNELIASGIDRQKVVRDLKLHVIKAYYGVIEARQVHEVALSGVSSIRAHMDVAQAFYDQGMIPKNDLLEAQVRYAEGEQNLIMAENAVKLSESNFNLLLARNLSEPVLIDADIPFPTFDQTHEEALATALSTRQELKTIEIQLDSAEKGVAVARSVYYPSIAASYTYERTGEDPDVEDDAWTAAVGLTWNIFEGGKNYWNVSRAKSIKSKLSYLMEGIRNQIALEVKSAFLSTQESKARTLVAEKAIDQAKENLRIQKDRYNLQVATSTNVLDAQALLDQAKKNYISARADYAKAIATLKAAMGTL